MDYARVLVGESYRISGYDLRPLQVGHLPLLEAIGCEPVETPEQLAMAILVCRHDWKDSRDLLFHRRFLNARLWLIARRILRHGYPSRMEHWGEYVRLNTTLPEIATEETASKSSGTPFMQHLRTTLIGRCNYNPDTVMSAPYLQAMWDYISHWETEGQCDIYDREYLDDMRAQHEEFNASLTGKREDPYGHR
jgi:hypothetical protein|tara:strand:+ start:6423 stop:7001 length:579 start_codon:yes stop_codon:yes gene_type:complete